MFYPEYFRRTMFEVGVSQAQLACFCGVHSNKIGPFLNGGRDLKNADILKIDKTLRDLKTIVAIFPPAPLSFKNAFQIKELLRKLEVGDYTDRISEIKAGSMGVA